jgi:hypothetical protein
VQPCYLRGLIATNQVGRKETPVPAAQRRVNTRGDAVDVEPRIDFTQRPRPRLSRMPVRSERSTSETARRNRRWL